ncbi:MULTISPECIES: cupin domain-containing protein [Streptomyces]|uniref:Cupin n=1 Tax=Streptomyces diastatochromogenes TaxID=42236 RepID=A0A233S5D3_STRDA|nr:MULTISPECIES: cupin domain-containing protein [Streptomyces]OXY90793.1 cupin [Streptomyces diastatochromogenes]SOD83413.1 Mannose-6-phosphate isomerase, cupin superfamily [Streptomyces sp. Ag109_G2-15]
MSLFVPKFDESVIVRDAEAEVVGGAPVGVKLLADSSASGGALSTVRVTLGEGADGARPHLHHNSAEMFYLLDGAAELLSGDDIVTAERGDLVIVPPGKPHAFAAVPGSTADILIVITPGVERFEYFRHLQRLRLGEATLESLLEAQELYDNHYLQSVAWEGRR